MVIRLTWKQYTGDDRHFYRQAEVPIYMDMETAEEFFAYMYESGLTADVKTKIRLALWMQDPIRPISIRLYSSTGYHQMELRKHKGVIFHKRLNSPTFSELFVKPVS